MWGTLATSMWNVTHPGGEKRGILVLVKVISLTDVLSASALSSRQISMHLLYLVNKVVPILTCTLTKRTDRASFPLKRTKATMLLCVAVFFPQHSSGGQTEEEEEHQMK